MAGDNARELLYRFQELCHYWNELAQNNSEKECLMLVDFIEKMRVKWLEAHNENLGLRTMIESLEKDVEYKNDQLKERKAQLIEARAQIASLVSTKQAIEADRAELERQVDLVRDLLKDDVRFIPEAKQKNYAFLHERKPKREERPNSMSVDDRDIDYDRTEDSVDEDGEVSTLRNGRKWTRVSVPRGQKRATHRSPGKEPSHTSPIQEDEEQPLRKRSKEDGEFKEDFGKHGNRNLLGVYPSTGGGGVLESGRRRSRKMNRSFSEPHIGPQIAPSAPVVPEGTLPGRVVLGSQGDLRTPAAGTPSSLLTWTSGSALKSRRHLFVGKTVLKPEYCDFCRKRVGFGKSAFKCQDCQYLSHEECKNQVPLPCVPRNPSTPKSGRNGKLRDFTPSVPPMVPPLVIHCVLELERRALNTLGLYRIPGAESDVQKLLTQFLNSRGAPNLQLVDDVHVLTGCLKRFLTQLREPLIPASSWHEFVRASESKSGSVDDFSKLHQAISDLPLPNRDTLAFLILHWQKVVECSEENKMPIENLSKVLGPTVVGYSTETVGMHEAIQETPKQEAVMNALLNLPRDYWQRFLNFPDSQPLMGGAESSPNTPELVEPALHFTMLGPFPSGTRPTTPKAGSSLKTRSGRRGFFPPPWK